ncbi:hypothetical protein M0804_012711 [Polistes exclamans]|nr:hypothetical protein M0804_012711 [Polistes exclamans]
MDSCESTTIQAKYCILFGAVNVDVVNIDDDDDGDDDGRDDDDDDDDDGSDSSSKARNLVNWLLVRR